MKSIILPLNLVVLLISSAFAQDMQYVSKQSGDTLWVKDSYEYGDNTLYMLMRSDSLAPATRVYFLKAGGVYGCDNNPSSSEKCRTIVMGPEQNLKTGSPTMRPPIITGNVTSSTGVAVYGGMNINKDLLVKNIDLELGNVGSNGGWAFFGFEGPNMRLEVENCIMEHTWWTWVGAPPSDESIFFNNCYFVNLNGYPCRRNGGVVDFDGRGVTHQDTLSVQNCTHVNTQGTLYRFRNGYTVDRVIFNHNDFIDCAGYVLMNSGDQTNLSITNNIYVNCQLQAYCPVLSKADVGEVDADSLAMGLVNVRVDSTFSANVGTHGIYVNRNLSYWDPSLSDIVSTLNAKTTNGNTHWVSQMIQMNSRTSALFADKTHYPKLYNGGWISKLPTFSNADVLFSTQLDVVKAYAIAAVDTSYASPLKSWRQSTNPEASNPIHADWPIPIDLSYTDADLLTAGLGGFPLGDLGWFPTQFASWKAQRATELANIQSYLDGVTGVATAKQELPQGFQLQQNYPNPFNPSTVISYSLAKAGNVTLKVYGMLGQEVATLVNGYQAANTYHVNFNASGLASGLYVYELRSGSYVASGKMLLMK